MTTRFTNSFSFRLSQPLFLLEFLCQRESLELAQLQQQFLHVVNTTDTALFSAIAPHARLTPTTQPQIYHQNTQLTRCKTLQTIYPILQPS